MTNSSPFMHTEMLSRRDRLKRIFPRSPGGRLALCLLIVACFIVVAITWDEMEGQKNLILGTIVLGVITSTIGAWAFSWIYDKSVWSVDISRIEGRLDRISRHIDEHNELINEFPKAIGETFPIRLYSYYPYTSQRIAEIIGDITKRLYSSHCRRVHVAAAADRYILQGVEVVNIDSTDYVVWNVEFEMEWTWVNDSRCDLYPFADLIIIVAAPEAAYDDWFKSHESERDRLHLEYKKFVMSRNLVHATIVHPKNQSQHARIMDDDVDKLMSIDGITFRYRGETVSVRPQDFEMYSGVDKPEICYRAYSMPTKERDRVLAVGEKLKVSYKGHMKLPLIVNESTDSGTTTGNGDTGKVMGVIEFPPSDVIGNKYELYMDLPKTTINTQGQTYNLKYNNDECGLFIFGTRDNEPPSPRSASIDRGFIWRYELHVDGKAMIPEYHRVVISWEGIKV